MLFNTLAYAVFFGVVFVVAWLLARHVRLRLWFLLLASYYFYAVWDWRFTGLLAASTLVSYAAGLALDRPEARSDRRRAKRILAAALVFNLGVLGFFKYAGFFVDSAAQVLTTQRPLRSSAQPPSRPELRSCAPSRRVQQPPPHHPGTAGLRRDRLASLG